VPDNTLQILIETIADAKDLTTLTNEMQRLGKQAGLGTKLESFFPQD